ncbi:MAG: hypothetical protein AVDCRST_MAG88-823, partial [uncultured Thermomicrobiales bacterium]
EGDSSGRYPTRTGAGRQIRRRGTPGTATQRGQPCRRVGRALRQRRADQLARARRGADPVHHRGRVPRGQRQWGRGTARDGRYGRPAGRPATLAWGGARRRHGPYQHHHGRRPRLGRTGRGL